MNDMTQASPTPAKPKRPRPQVMRLTDAAAERIGELACGLLDRALRDRPGPLRLVGVGLSGLEEHVQLSLPAVV